MTTRRFGPTRGAGVAILEQSGDQQIDQGALGFAAYGGPIPRGRVGELITALTKPDYEAQCGGFLFDDGELPQSAKDYYNLANGTGGLFVVRVTDGNEVQAVMPIYTRQLPRTQLGTLKADNGGRWGGKQKYATAETATDVATDIAEFTIDTGLTMTTDEFKGGTVELDGVPNRSYTITGNDNTGLVAVEADSTMNADLVGGADPTNNRFYLILENESLEVTVTIGDGIEDPDNEFQMTVFLDGDKVRDYENLNTDPASGNYWVDIINDDSANYYVIAEDLFTGSHQPSARPANHYESFTALTATILTATIHEFSISSAGGGDPTFALGTTSDDHLKQQITLTMADPTTFTAVSDVFGDLGTAASGTLGVEYVPNNKWTPPFTVTAGGTALSAADVLTIQYKPFVVDQLIDGLLYPDPDTDRRLFFRIVDNNHKTITVAAGSDMATDVTVTSGVAATGDLTFPVQADIIDGETVVLDDGVHPAITFHMDQTGTYVPGGGYDATNIQVDISGDITANDVAVTAKAAIDAATGAAFEITAGALAVDTIPLSNTAANGAVGNVAILETVVDAAMLVNGMDSGISASVDEFRVQATLPMEGGRDGVADLADADFTLQLFDTSSSPFNRVFGGNFGLVKFAVPGITSTAVQKAGVAYAAAKNYQYRYEVPSNITTESAVDALVNDTLGRSDYAVVSFPSRGFIANPDGSDRRKEISLTGMIHGREARMAADFDGHHKAQAGTDAVLPDVLDITTGDAVLNEEFLNPKGINVIKKNKGNFILWGDRTLWLNTEWKWKHQRELMSYYEHVLQESFDFIVFAINDSENDGIALVSLQSFFLPEFVKRAIRGDTFEDAAILKVDAENNTDATRADGDLFADVKLRLADTVERFNIRIGKQGIFESVG